MKKQSKLTPSTGLNNITHSTKSFSPRAIYIHWPYCRKICPYCDFVIKKNQPIDENAWLSAYIYDLKKQISFLKSKQLNKLTSIYFGGGTPSLMPVKLMQYIINYLHKTIGIDNTCEITCEANIEDYNLFKGLKTIGINRLSLGLQSTNKDELLFLGRGDTFPYIDKSFAEVKKYFNNFSCDIIYSLPRFSLKNLQATIEKIISFVPNHISAYSLTIEKTTKFYLLEKKGELKQKTEEKQIAEYNLIKNILKQHNYDHYEISNYAKPDKQSKHNKVYWSSLPFYALGPGAQGRITNDKQFFEVSHNRGINSYLNIAKNDNLSFSQLHNNQIIVEIIATTLRTKTGLNLLNPQESQSQALVKKELQCLFNHKIIKELIKDNLLLKTDNGFKIPQNKWLIADHIIYRITSII